MLCTFVAMTTTKFLSLILYSLRGLSSLRTFPGRNSKKKKGRVEFLSLVRKGNRWQTLWQICECFCVFITQDHVESCSHLSDRQHNIPAYISFSPATGKWSLPFSSSILSFNVFTCVEITGRHQASYANQNKPNSIHNPSPHDLQPRFLKCELNYLPGRPSHSWHKSHKMEKNHFFSAAWWSPGTADRAPAKC